MTTHESSGPYYFPDLADAAADAEQAAIDAGEIKAGCLRYAGSRRAAHVLAFRPWPSSSAAWSGT